MCTGWRRHMRPAVGAAVPEPTWIHAIGWLWQHTVRRACCMLLPVCCPGVLHTAAMLCALACIRRTLLVAADAAQRVPVGI